VVDKTNFTGDTWISAEGRVSFHSDALHIVERYRRLDSKTLEIEATIEDPKVLTKPWVVPKQTLQLAPFDQIFQLACSDDDIQSFKDATPPAISGKTDRRSRIEYPAAVRAGGWCFTTERSISFRDPALKRTAAAQDY
jgi:hypothetical protein